MPPERIPTSTLPLKADVLLVLLALAQEPLHGYALMQKIEVDSNGAVVLQAGAFYRMLRNMLQDDLVEECDDPSPSGRDAKARRFYRISRHGRAVARAEVDRLAAVVKLSRTRDLAGRRR